MSYVLTDGKGYISRMKGGKIVVTYDFDLATKYPTETHALEFLRSLNKSYNQKGYRPKRVEAKEKQLPPLEKQKLEPVRNKTEESEELTQLRNNLMMIDQILGSLKDLYSKKYNELTEASDTLEDISHAIEFTNANAVQRLSPSRKNGQEKCEKSRMKQTGANESKVKRQKLHTAAFQNRRAISIQSKSEDELCCRKLQYKQRYRSVPPAWSGSGADEPAHISDS